MSLESAFLDWLESRSKGRAAPSDSTLVAGIGDDGAVLPASSRPTVIVGDAIAEGTHFLREQVTLAQIGHKALAVNLSDVAAMGAEPAQILVQFQLPRAFDLDDICELYGGIEALADEFEAEIVGGDTNVWDGDLVIAVTVLGHPLQSSVWTQNGAQPGDAIIVTGSFGGSQLIKHCSFTPRLAEARRLAAQSFPISACTDVSDSLSLNLDRILRHSHCGARLCPDAIPLSPDLPEWMALSDSRLDPLDHAMGDGEDFELIVTLEAKIWEREVALSPARSDWTRIGTVEPEPGIRWEDGTPVRISGYRH